MAFGFEAGVGFRGFGGVDLVVVGVRFEEFGFIEEEGLEAVVGGELELGIHADGVEGTDFDADATAHADGDVNVEDFGALDGFTVCIAVLDDVDALRGAFFFADFAGGAADAGFGVIAVVNEEGEDASALG